MKGKTTGFLLVLVISFNEGISGNLFEPHLLNTAADTAADLAEHSRLQLIKIPDSYKAQITTALAHFPELANTSIKFRVRRSVSTLKTRPAFISMFMPKGHRTYIIIISNKTLASLTPLTFLNLPEKARIGVIGHELSHVVDFSKKSLWQSLKCAVAHLSKHYMDSLEFNTDKICIEHGLGYELEAWSGYIRNTMHTLYWRGADYVKRGDTHYERYMNPATIEKYIHKEMPVANPAIINAY